MQAFKNNIALLGLITTSLNFMGVHLGIKKRVQITEHTPMLSNTVPDFKFRGVDCYKSTPINTAHGLQAI